jgi:hypothetical protein
MFRSASLVDIARHLTGAAGYDKNDIAQRAMSSDQFTLLLGNVANRVVADSFEKQEGTYGLWTKHLDLPDFRIRNEVSPISRCSRSIKETI